MPRSLTKMSSAECGVVSSSSICGTRFTNIQLEPAAEEMTSNSCRVSRPARAPSAIASAAAAMCTPARSWLTIFTLLPAPGGPLMRNRAPGVLAVMGASTRAARAQPSSVPEDMMVREPAAARATPPDTGASTNSSPRPIDASCAAMRFAALGGTVEHSTTTAPSASPAAASAITASACSALTTISTRCVAPAEASATLAAVCPPAAAKRSSEGAHTSKARTGRPAPRRTVAIPEPIAPSPTKPTEPAIGERSDIGTAERSWVGSYQTTVFRRVGCRMCGWRSRH
mmetsp:Transcript_29381/g.75425  ORF Transcript_29381/g.75425 Transcript_29381/m.75425 type:complete len:285 (+) Transcript_29381:197-1051(+)